MHVGRAMPPVRRRGSSMAASGHRSVPLAALRAGDSSAAHQAVPASSVDWNRLARIGWSKVGSSICSETYSPAFSPVRFHPAPISAPVSLLMVSKHMDAVVGRVLSVGRLGRNDDDVLDESTAS